MLLKALAGFSTPSLRTLFRATGGSKGFALPISDTTNTPLKSLHFNGRYFT